MIKPVRKSLGRLGACILLVCAMVSPSAQAADQDLGRLRQQFDRYLVKLGDSRKDQQSRWEVGYARALQALEKKIQSEGKLDGLIAVKEELKRFKESRAVLEEMPGDALDELRELQDRYRESRSSFELEHNQKIIKLAEQYDARLAEYQKRLTMDGDIDEALKIREERHRAADDATVTAAKYELAVLEDSGVEHVGDVDKQGGSADAPVKDDDTPEPGHGVKIYTEQAAPALPGLKFKRLSLSRTVHSTMAGGLTVSAQEASLENSRHEGGDFGRWEKRETVWHLRLSLRGARGVMENALVVAEFYTKDAAPKGRIDLKPYLTRQVPLRTIGSSPVTLDYPPITTEVQRNKGRGSAWRIRGEEMYGVIVSIFDADEKLVYQEASHRSLSEMAVATAPGDSGRGGSRSDDSTERLIRAKADAEARYRALLKQFQAAGRSGDKEMKQKLRQAHNELQKAMHALESQREQD